MKNTLIFGLSRLDRTPLRYALAGLAGAPPGAATPAGRGGPEACEAACGVPAAARAGGAGALAPEVAEAGHAEPDQVRRAAEPQHVVGHVADPQQRGQAERGGQRPDGQAGQRAARGDPARPAATAHGVAHDEHAVRARREDHQRRGKSETEQGGGHRHTLRRATAPGHPHFPGRPRGGGQPIFRRALAAVPAAGFIVSPVSG